MSRKGYARNSQRRKLVNERRAERYSQIGYQFEDAVEKLLHKMEEEGLIQHFWRHSHHSIADHQGKDFTVRSNSGQEKSFGVTISIRCWNESKVKHPDIPQLCFPIGSHLENLKKRILELFQGD